MTGEDSRCVQCGRHIAFDGYDHVYDKHGTRIPLHRGGCPRPLNT